MKHDAMMEMSKSALDDYGKVIGIDVSGKKTVAAKVEAIEGRRARVAEIDVLGITMTVPIKRLHDKRVSDLYGKPALKDEEADELFHLILGDEQAEKAYERATDEDGTIDVDALGVALACILKSDELKNF